MRAIILSAGLGSRLLPLTEFMPKCLVPVAGKAILDHQLAALAHAGVSEATVVVGYRADQVARHLIDTPPPLKVDLRFNPFWALASSIGSVWAARDVLHEMFCLMNGDTAFSPALIERAIRSAPQGVGLVVEPLDDLAEDDMCVRVKHGAVTHVSKSLRRETATHRSLGLIVSAAGSGYADALAHVIGSSDGPGRFHHDVIDALARTERVEAIVERSGDWVEIDRPEDIERWGARRVSV